MFVVGYGDAWHFYKNIVSVDYIRDSFFLAFIFQLKSSLMTYGIPVQGKDACNLHYQQEQQELSYVFVAC